MPCRHALTIANPSMKKGSEPEAHRKLMQNGVIYPWDDQSKHEAGGAVGAFKYRHKTREGHYEDSLPTLSQEIRTVSTSRRPSILADL